MLRRLLLSVLPFALGACASADPEPSSAKDIRAAVEAALRAGFERHDYAAYMAPWHKNSRITFGRTPSPGADDITYEYETFAAAKQLSFSGPPPAGVTLRFENSKVSEQGFDAMLLHVVVVEAGELVEVVGERYLLRRGADGWRILENRWWPIRMGRKSAPLAFVGSVWKGLDRQVRQQRAAGDLRALTGTLMSSFRYPEALAAARQWCGREPSTVDAWRMRGYAAARVGEVDESVRAYKQAATLDPGVELPAFVKAARTNR